MSLVLMRRRDIMSSFIMKNIEGFLIRDVRDRIGKE